ncbi:MAG: glycosyltransferase family 2 protein [Steroidobacteraceae bacterium]
MSTDLTGTIENRRSTLSVVIATCNAAAVIGKCLDALLLQQSASMEIVVADASTDDTAAIVAQDYPSVRLLRCPVENNVAQLRGRGIAACTGAIVAVIDPYCIVAPDWVEAVTRRQLQGRGGIVGGYVEPWRGESMTLSQWAIYFNEYGHFMLPMVAGESSVIPGSNVSYPRDLLFDDDKPRFAIFWKTFVNWQAAAAGVTPQLDPEMGVSLNKPIALLDFLLSRFFHGRCFAGMRAREESLSLRTLRAIGAPLVPLLLFWRLVSTVAPKRRHRWRFAFTCPLQLAFFTMWGIGEFVGYISGSGKACQHVRF